MSSWIRADADFGCPVMTLTLDARGRLGQEFRDIIRKCGKNAEDKPWEMWTAEMESPVTAFLELARPDLRGLILFGFSMRQFGRWEFNIAHPSLRWSQSGEVPPKQRLEVCWTCGRPLSADGVQWRRIDTMAGEEVCSEMCATAERPPKFELSSLPLPIVRTESLVEMAKAVALTKHDAANCPTCRRGLERAKLVGGTYNATTLPKSDWIGSAACDCEWSAQLVLPSGLRYGEAQKCCLPKGHEGPCKSATNVIKGEE